MDNKLKEPLWKLIKTIGSAVIVFVTSMFANWIGTDGSAVAVIGGAIAGSLMA